MSFADMLNNIKTKAKARYSDYQSERLADRAAEKIAQDKYRAEMRRQRVLQATAQAKKDAKTISFKRSGTLADVARSVNQALNHTREKNRKQGMGSMFDPNYDLGSGKRYK